MILLAFMALSIILCVEVDGLADVFTRVRGIHPPISQFTNRRIGLFEAIAGRSHLLLGERRR